MSLSKSIKFLLFLMLSGIISAQSYKTRQDIPEKYKWNTADLYKNTEAWQKNMDELEKTMVHIGDYKGRLGESAQTLKEALDVYSNILQQFYKLSSYAGKIGDEDLNNADNQELRQAVSILGTKFSEQSSYMVPELIAVGSDKINSFIKELPDLQEYDMYLKDIMRRETHTLSPAEEAIMATTGIITKGAYNIFSVFSNAEMPLASLKLSDGEEVTLSKPMFAKLRTTANRTDRKNVFKTFFENYGKFNNTMGANLVANLNNDYFYAKTRKYSSCLEASLDDSNIPVSVYENLIEQINKNLPVLHRYLKLKKKILGVDTLHFYDLYMPITKKVDLQYSIEEGQKYIKKALKPMGKQYTKVLDKAFNERWIDYFPTPGKRGGAYSSGSAYDVHPYILLNWIGDYNSLTTMAHELGHTMHSYFSNSNQPFMKADYATFVAEIASTFNENLLNNYLINHAKTKEEKLYLLGSYLEVLRTTIFRQTLFAEFEWEIHKRIENDEPLTGKAMNKIYYDINKKYYGHDEGICIVDPYIQYEWQYIPHFYYNFYVYQYATSLIYSTAFAEKVINKEKNAVNNYYKLLKGGASEYPTDIIKKAGIDPFSSEAFELTMHRMNKVMDEIEKLLEK